ETPTPRRGPKPSMASQEASDKAKVPQKQPKKRTLADTLVQIQRENISALKAQRDTQLLLDLHKQITAEARAGIWTPAQAREKLLQIETAQENPLPLKRQKTVRSPSPDWPSELDSSEEEL
ncbi:hypothetical protein HYPSUDRAFT_146730, partial [Hypholoma sublateritium FD-334 SS-4]